MVGQGEIQPVDAKVKSINDCPAPKNQYPAWATTLSLTGKFAITSSFMVVYLLSSELSTTKNRTLTVGISNILARSGSMVSPYIIDLIGEKNSSVPGIVFGVISFIGGLLSFLLPETRKAILPESRADIEKLNSRGEKHSLNLLRGQSNQ
ncbi:organic anion transporter 3-like [Oratosquilla oratoria]|uniref:organic anion transporter 3-like n=1 Tax=Oratosquilla oratoria TaxID=337810 RepID=UPI003F76F83B